MDHCKVTFDKMTDSATRIAQLRTSLRTVQQSLSGVNSIIGSVISCSFPALVSNIRAIGNQMDDISSLKSALDRAIELYRSTERSIVATSDGSNSGTASEPADPLEGRSYDEILEYRREHAVDENTRLVYERYINRVRINDDDYDDTAHYNSIRNHINYNRDEDAVNERGVGNTYYHEVGHLIDDQSDWNSHTSTDWSYDFYDCLENDLNRWLDNCMRENNYTNIQDAYDALSDWLWEDPNMKNGISDLINGLTGGEACGRWRHYLDYYNSGSICREAFAHFFEAGMSHESTKLDYIREMFPSAYEEFQQMLIDELN